MNRTILTIAGLLACWISTQALADTVSPDWSGPYIGLAAGISDHNAEWTDLADDWFSGSLDLALIQQSLAFMRATILSTDPLCLDWRAISPAPSIPTRAAGRSMMNLL